MECQKKGLGAREAVRLSITFSRTIIFGFCLCAYSFRNQIALVIVRYGTGLRGGSCPNYWFGQTL